VRRHNSAPMTAPTQNRQAQMGVDDELAVLERTQRVFEHELADL
jgi:hypothetical protein